MFHENKIIKEEEVLFLNDKYQKITYENEEVVFRRYDTEYKMWAELKFNGSDDGNLIIKNLCNLLKSCS